MTGIRSIVLIEPYGPLDFSICNTTAQAVAEIARLRDLGRTTRLFETTGTIKDLRSEQRRLRADYVAMLAEQVTA